MKHVRSGPPTSLRGDPAVFSRRGLTLVLGSLPLAATGCGDPSTAGIRVELATWIEPGALELETAAGWKVSVERCLVSVGPLRYVEAGAVALGGALPAGVSAWLWSLVVGTAHAHPGHAVGGGTLGEMLAPFAVDLTSGATPLGRFGAVSGLVRSAHFSFHSPPAGPLAAELGRRIVVLEGRAENASGERRFRAEARLADVLDAEGRPVVEGCSFEDGDLGEDGTVTLRIEPKVWLDQVDFAELPAGSAERVDLTGAAHDTFARGLKKPAAYRFHYRTGLVE